MADQQMIVLDVKGIFLQRQLQNDKKIWMNIHKGLEIYGENEVLLQEGTLNGLNKAAMDSLKGLLTTDKHIMRGAKQIPANTTTRIMMA